VAFRRNILQEDDILSKLYVDSRSDVSDCSDSDVPASSRKQLRSSVVVDSSDSESSTVAEECSEPDNCDDCGMWCKMDKNEAMSLSLEQQV
jgi:hypothetical protein